MLVRNTALNFVMPYFRCWMLLKVFSPQLKRYFAAGCPSKNMLKQVSVSAEGVASALAVHLMGAVRKRAATVTIELEN